MLNRYGPALACVSGRVGPAVDTHTRIRHDRIGIGRTHIIMLVADLHVRVINATTGELLRELTIDPTRDYQPQNQKPPNPGVQGFPMS